MPKLSICVPVYNGEKFLKETIESILSQTYADFELIIVDNASTDNTTEIVKAFKSGRILYVRNEKTLPCPENWNRCIELAKGEYIAIYHSDDIYSPGIVERQVMFLDNNPDVGAVFTMADTIDENGNKTGSLRLPKGMKGKEVFPFKDIFIQLIRNNRNPLICPTCMSRKSLYQEAGGYDTKQYKYVFDIDMYLRMAERMAVAVLDVPLIQYRIHGSQGSKRYASEASDHNEVYDMYDRYILKHRELLTKSDLDRYECFKGWDYTVHSIKALYRGDSNGAKSLLRKAFSAIRLIPSFTDINLFLRLCISVFFLFVTYLGMGRFFSRLALSHRLGYL